MAEVDSKEVKEWFEHAIETAREESGHLAHGLDLTEPCQIEVFWMHKPLCGQVFIITHDRDRPDGEILVHGPFSGSSFVEETGDIVQADRWQQPIPPPRDTIPGRGPPSRADLFTNTISRFIGRIEESIFADYSIDKFLFGGQRLWDNTFTHIFLGNVAEYEIEELLRTSTGSDSDDTQENDEEVEQESQEAVNESVPVNGGYVYEPAWIEKAPEYTFSERVWSNKRRSHDRVYDAEISGLEFHAFRDGLLVLRSKDATEVQDILNTIFGVGLLHQHRQWRPLLKREIYSASLRDGEIGSSSYELSTPSGRNQLADPREQLNDTDRSLLQVETLEQYVEITDTIYPIHNVRDRAILHLQAHSHLLDDEFEAAHVLNWTVVEQLLDDQLKDQIHEDRDLEWEDKNLEFAELAGLISQSEYELLDKHRDNRNTIIHEMGSVSVKEAEELDILVSKLLVRNINKYLKAQEQQTIEYRPYPVKFPNGEPEVRWELSNL